MAWKCACGKRNELYNLNCPYCGKKIPQMERNKIYIDELFVQVRECLVLVKASAPVQYVISALLDIKKDIAQFLKGAKKEDLKYLIALVGVFGFIIISMIVQITGREIDLARMQRYQRREFYIERRIALNENIKYKLNNAIENSGLGREITPENQAVKAHFETKKQHLRERLSVAAVFIINYVRRGYEKCLLYFD